jgi:uncharacterized membrane protein
MLAKKIEDVRMNIVSEKRFWFFIIVLNALALFFYSSSAKAEERITTFVSDISLNRDASADIVETITANVEGRMIRHGLMRNLLMSWRDGSGNTHDANYQIMNVWQNGVPVKYHLGNDIGKLSIYVGSADVLLSPGAYVYQIKYHVSNVVTFYKDKDEFYWNITGNAWQFPIDQVTANITMPANANIIQYAGYTGPLGAKDQDFYASTPAVGSISFSTTKMLQPGEGLTVAVAFPKGIVRPPTWLQNLKSQRGNFLTLEIIFFLIGYYVLVWCWIAREPDKGTIIPLFEPPAGVSPAAMRYIVNMGYDDNTYAIAIVSMAAKGFLTIEDSDGTYILTKNKNADYSALSTGEQAIADDLFTESSTLLLSQDNYQQIGNAKSALKNSLDKEFDNIYFLSNAFYLLPGCLLSLMGYGMMMLSVQGQLDAPSVFFVTVWVFIWTATCYGMFTQMIRAWRLSLSGRSIGAYASAIWQTLIILPFLLGEVVGIFIYSLLVSFTSFCLLFVLILINIIFHHVLKAHTPTGRKVMDQIEGFKLFLSVTESDRYAKLNPPEKTPALFEKYLPYAMALDISQEWSNQFTDVLRKASVGQAAYQPSWYVGSSWSSMSTGAFSGYLTTGLATSLASSSVSPSSSGGGFSGGGGSSGGGGGGGGGGGW